MNVLKYFIIILICLPFDSLSAGDTLRKIDSVSLGYFIDESTPIPFSPVLNLKFGIPDSAIVTVEVHKIEEKDENGRFIKSRNIKTILMEKLPKGMYLINWGGKDSLGNTQSYKDHFIYYIKIERKTITLYGDGFVKLEAKTKITSPILK